MFYVPPYDWAKWFCCGFSTVGNGAILANGCGIQGQNYFAFLQGSEVIAVFHCKD